MGAEWEQPEIDPIWHEQMKISLGSVLPNPIAIAAKGKGYSALARRMRTIGKRYSLNAAKFDRALQLLVSVLHKYDCGASFPITASTLARHGRLIEKYQAQNVEFAIHGLFHVDYSQLPLDEQCSHIERAQQIFQRQEINLAGFRSPYLRWNDDTLTAVANSHLDYDSSQSIYWEVAGGQDIPGYRHVLAFYRAQSANEYPALPRMVKKIIQIPYCLPDDEALIERLKISGVQAMSDIWLTILERTYESGELFTLGLHPERSSLLHEPLASVLARARSLSPKVWIARLDEVARWWRAHSQAAFEIVAERDDVFQLTVHGPPGTTVLARNVEVRAPTTLWENSFDRIMATSFQFRASKRPCIGLSPDSDPRLLDFLRQQGYWVETSSEDQAYSIYLKESRFAAEDKRPLLRQLDQSDAPLIRLGRWPDGARSALCISGDIDAMTLCDYGLRMLGR